MIDGAIILLYHRVTTPDRDPQLLCVSPENFKSQLEWISNHFTVIPLQAIGRALACGQQLKDSVAITFDDGYADNLLEAAPILSAFDCPATVFATTGLTDCHREFFWDDLDRIFLASGTLPRTFAALGIELGDSATYDGRFASWTVLDPHDPTPRHATYRRLTSKLHESTIVERRDMLDQLQVWSNVPLRKSHRMMTAVERDALISGARSASSALITLGGHTVDHCRLSAELLEVQSQQIRQNRSSLGNPPAFSYPFGTRHDYTDATVELVKQAGYEIACANFGGTVTGASDRYRLPRRIVRDWPIDQCIAEFNRWITPRGVGG
jgi:peptidoglycan/xylan/chitin deacetylase (PgdA/CDA1 family)